MENISNTNFDTNTKFNIFMIKSLSLSPLMCHAESFQSVKLNYPLNSELPKVILTKKQWR